VLCEVVQSAPPAQRLERLPRVPTAWASGRYEDGSVYTDDTHWHQECGLQNIAWGWNMGSTVSVSPRQKKKSLGIGYLKRLERMPLREERRLNGVPKSMGPRTRNNNVQMDRSHPPTLDSSKSPP